MSDKMAASESQWSWEELIPDNMEALGMDMGPNIGPLTNWAHKYGQSVCTPSFISY